MALLQEILVLGLLVLCMTMAVSSHGRSYTPPNVPRLTDLFGYVSVGQGFKTYYGASNTKVLNNGSYVNLVLDKTSGSGLVSQNRYYYGFFSAAIKLPSGLSPGVVVAFYKIGCDIFVSVDIDDWLQTNNGQKLQLSNAENYPHNHDEIDIELLGHDKRNDWVLQTNIYSNRSLNTGREEKFYLWFDPTEEHHHYSIIWNSHHIVFLLDNIPVREYVYSNSYPSAYPSKPMSLYATIWDGSEWATHGGKYPVNYKYGPFVVSFAEMEMTGCVFNQNASSTSCSNKDNPSSFDPVVGQDFLRLSKEQSVAMDWARRRLMFYSYCNDRSRFKVLPPECK